MKWLMSDIKFIKNNLHLTDVQLANKLNRKPDALRQFRLRRGILKPNDGRFKPGNEPKNKGQQMSAEKYEKLKATMFKPGHKPVNRNRQMYEVFIRKDGVFIKTPDNRQYPYPRYVYEQLTGTRLSKNVLIICKDGNQLNVQQNNLAPLSKAEIISRNANRQKASASLKATWDKVKLYDALHIPHRIGFKSKRKTA